MITGNKGEWSELYVLLRLLADGKLYSADADLQKLEHIYSPILRIFRNEAETGKMEYKIKHDKKQVVLYINGDMIKSIPSDILAKYAETCFKGIINGTDASFHIDGSAQIMDDIKCKQIKAPSEDKTDIRMEISDRMTGYNTIVGYSIKSELGHAPSLLNASKATNFRFNLTGIDDDTADKINNIKTRATIHDRIAMIEENGSMEFSGACNDTFKRNLMLIDSRMEEIISQMVLEYFKYRNVTCADIAEAIERKDPLQYRISGFYRYKIKKFLCAVALGMVPSKEWDGKDEANGGYIIVKESGEVVAYHLYNRNAFETYLLNNTKLETASTKRHDFGTVASEYSRKYFNLNLQVRFI